MLRVKNKRNSEHETYPVIKGRAKSKDVFTLPNILSIVRILLIPVILYLYIGLKERFFAACVLAFSYASDIADGIIARKFNMISDVGKMLDPFADKLTQASLVICIAVTRSYTWTGWMLFGLLAAKEIATALSGFFAVRRTGVVSGAKWYGKVSTLALNTMFALILFIPMPDILEKVLLFVCAGVMILSAAAYLLFFNKKYDE